MPTVFQGINFFISAEIWAGVLCFAAFIYRLVGRLPKQGKKCMSLLLLVAGAMMISDAFSWGFNSQSGDYVRFILNLTNFVCFFGPYLICYIFGWYMKNFLSYTKPIMVLKGLMYLDALLGMALVVVDRFNHMYYYFDANNTYQRGPLYILSQAIGVIVFAIVLIIILVDRKNLGLKMFWCLFAYVGLPASMTIYSVFRQRSYSLLNLGIALAVLIMFLSMMQMQRKMLDEQKEQLMQKEKEISEMQISIVMSQIQPHFIFNCLNAIYYLCDKDSLKAQKAIDDFSTYLRGNMDSLKIAEPIFFQQELDHVRTYLELEQMRFEEELDVVYDLEVVDFRLPPLALQPLVENAVKHGVGKKIGGGTVVIKTREDTDSYIVIVEDDGIGFDMNQKKEDGRSHIGIDNVRHRLKEMCNARLDITSEAGKGTKATIRIPKENEN